MEHQSFHRCYFQLLLTHACELSLTSRLENVELSLKGTKLPPCIISAVLHFLISYEVTIMVTKVMQNYGSSSHWCISFVDSHHHTVSTEGPLAVTPIFSAYLGGFFNPSFCCMAQL